ncbi:N-acetylmuramoyl-L-alanine amidase [Paradesulfitobacterium ferrireducens]|uniref:N-acetylmuramoyl-L-alanine amidase n=1 Tax=Paradesulfitobacterium ferrireducens TaxID=2816476 RepID=UPI001A8CD598|nr:N-acetylmuramoyl-L-alanine amidase [Paradesulfitobacterium ferrireducens]
MKAYRWKPRKRRNLLYLGLLVTALFVIGVFWRAEHQDAEIWNWTLGDKVVVIDAGHGGVDPGAVGKNQTLEKDITLAVAKRLQLLIEQGGGKAVMVRTEDNDLGTSQGLLKRKREDLAQRLQLAMDSQADVYLSIHANSFPNEKLSGAQVFYFADHPESKNLAVAVQQSLNSAINGKRVAKGNKDLFILKKANRTAITVEVGFVSNPTEEQMLKDPGYQQKLALAIYEGLGNYLSKAQSIKPDANNANSAK